MKRVLFVTTISGFLPQFEKNDVKILKEMGFEVHYASNFKNPIYTFDENELHQQGIVLHQIDVEKSPLRLHSAAKAMKQIRQIIDENEIGLVHCHNPVGGVAARIAAKFSRQRPYVIYTAHGFHFYKGAPVMNWLLFYTAERILARYTDQIITINSEDYLRACRFPLKPHGQVTQIYSVGVDPKRFAPKSAIKNSKRRELGIPEDAFHIVTAAELNKNKNQKIMIEAMALLPYHNIHYSICGEGPNEEYLRKIVRKKGLGDKVHILGFRTDMEEILQTADCFAFPSYREGLGVAAIEALLCEVPLIVSDNRGTREYALPDKNALICHADSAREFAAALEKLYSDSAFRNRMAANCRASAQKFTIEEVEKIMRKVYERAEYFME